jgi:hypothetical protein
MKFTPGGMQQDEVSSSHFEHMAQGPIEEGW